jgi:peptide chain release factor subunit 1
MDDTTTQADLRHLAVLLRDARAVDNSPTLLTVLLPGSVDVKEWEQKLGSRPQHRRNQDGEYMQNLSRASDNWQQFEKVAATAQRLFRQCVNANSGRLPRKGIVMFLGSSGRHEDIVFEPPSPVQAPVHLCDSKFRVEYLASFSASEVYGFVIVDGSGCLFGTLSGRERVVKHKFSVDLPKKHSKGGQSALRFARLRLEKRHNYLRKVSECAAKCFISGDAPNVSGIIIAGAAEFKTDLAASELLDARLHSIVLTTVDIAYGDERGFEEAIILSAATLKSLEFVREKQVISSFLAAVATGQGMCCFGIQDTIAALEMGADETLMVWNSLAHPSSQIDARLADLHVDEPVRLVDWIIGKSNASGARLEFVTDQSQEGSQFCKGFGGLGGVLRYAVDFELVDKSESDASDSDSDFE